MRLIGNKLFWNSWRNDFIHFFYICFSSFKIKCTSKYLRQIKAKTLSICQIMSTRKIQVQLKLTQINYISMNQLHHTANLSFGLMCKKTKHCWGCQQTFQFSRSKAKHDREKLSSLAELVQKFKFLQNSCMGKWFHEAELWGPYI